MTTTIAVLNQKGGVGKSMVAQNLAACAHLRGKRTLLRDGDAQATSWQWYSTRAEGSPLRGLRVERAEDPKLWHVAKFREAAEGFDVVVCDGPPSLQGVTVRAAICADVVVIPLRPAHADVWAAVQTKRLLDEADELREQVGLPPVVRRMVLNEVRPRVRETAEVLAALEPLGIVLLDRHLAHRVAYDRARGEGEAVVSFGDDAAARAEVEALYDAIVGEALGMRGAA